MWLAGWDWPDFGLQKQHTIVSSGLQLGEGWMVGVTTDQGSGGGDRGGGAGKGCWQQLPLTTPGLAKWQQEEGK